MEGNNSFNQQAPTMDDANTPTITVSPFDYSVENHFNAMNTIRKLSTTSSEEAPITETELQQLSSRITFLREWNYFSYKPKTVRFSCDVEGQQRRHVLGEVILPQFSAANVPKTEGLSTNSRSGKTSDDFVLYVGGHVWGLDWCPSIRQGPDCHLNSEFLAVSAHPPESSYHKIGAPLTGRGLIQIWCVVHAVKEEESPALKDQRKKTKQVVGKRGRPKKESLDDSQPLKKARGRPKKPTDIQKSLVNMNKENESSLPLAITPSLVSSPSLALVETTMSLEEHTLVKSSDIDLDLGGSNKEYQIDQATYSQLDNGVDKRLSICEKARGKPKKRRGRPKKTEDTKESLDTMDTGNESVISLALAETTMSLDEHTLVKSSDIDLGLGGSNRENQIDQATYSQLDNGEDKKLSICEKASGKPKKRRGRPKKTEDRKEPLDTMDTGNESVISLAIDSSLVPSKLLSLTDVTTGPDEHAPLNGHDSDVVDLNKVHPILQETAIPMYIGKDKKQLKPTKGRGGSKKQKNLKESLVDLCTKDKSVIAFIEATRCMEEHMDRKSCNEHVGSYDSKFESQVPQAAPAEVFYTGEKMPPPLKKTRQKAKKKKGMNESLVDLGTEERSSPLPTVTNSPLCYVEDDVLLESKSRRGRRIRKQKDMKDFVIYSENVPPLAKEGSPVSSDIPCPTDITWSREACVSPQSSDTDFEFETENLNSYRIRKKKKMKDKIKPGSHADGISLLVDHYKDRDSPFVLQNNNNNLQDVITPIQGKIGSLRVDHYKDRGSSNIGSLQDVSTPIQAKNDSLEGSRGSFDLPTDVALPRVFICLAHNGKVAWDVKWRPPSVPDAMHKNYIGHLAVVLGNGSLEVWEVPSPRAIEVLYSSCKKESTDPRFLKLEPLFRCSKLKFGARHSIPLTVEWSTSSPHDLLLAGCHDGTVALWKFTPIGLSQDTRPLLCFNADTHPIRALAWAPDGSDEESANVVVTAGHGSVRFWDIRDPYRPLGEPHTVRRFIYSLDWLQDPRCIMMAFDDGTLRCLSLSKAAYDVPVTGKPFLGTQQQGLHTYFCSSSPIWSVQTSRSTGQVVYCGADGSVLHFQLTSKAVDKDSSRYRAPHFLCGSLIKEDAALTVNTPSPDIPFPLKKSQNEFGEFRSVNALISDLSQAKRENHQTLDIEPDIPALCYHNDPSELDFGERFLASKAKSTSKTGKSKNPDPNSVQVDNLLKGENQEGRTEIEVLPPKIVAMHRVRWNHNKGSERWVCYGGAAGIVRCQEIFP